MANETLSATEKADLLSTVNSLSAKLHALLYATYGDQGEAFREMDGEIQDNYMWTCSDMATQLRDAAFKL